MTTNYKIAKSFSNSKRSLFISLSKCILIEDEYVGVIENNNKLNLIAQIHIEYYEKQLYCSVMIMYFSMATIIPLPALTKSKENIFKKISQFTLNKKSKLFQTKYLSWKSGNKIIAVKSINTLLKTLSSKGKQLITNGKKFNYFGLYKTNNIASELDSLKNVHCRDEAKNLNLLENDYHIMEIRQKIIGQKMEMDLQIEKESERLLFVSPKMIKKYLLGPVRPENRYKKCCVIDLDETLVHSSFQELHRYDFKITIEVDGIYHDIYILKRPYVDLFLTRMSTFFECVLFTASLAKYANPVSNLLCKKDIFHWKLYREACVFYKGAFVKDLSSLGRPLDQIVIIDNSPVSFLFHPENAIQIISWFDDFQDRALLDLIPYLQRLSQSQSALEFLRTIRPPQTATWPVSLFSQASSKSFNLDSITPGPITISNIISSARPNILASIKKNGNSSRTDLNRDMVQNDTVLKSYLTKTSTKTSTEKLINVNQIPSTSKQPSNLDIVNTKRFPVKMNRDSMNDKRLTVKQHLNSASDVFSPRYLNIKYN